MSCNRNKLSEKLSYAGRLYQAEVIGKQNQNKERDGKSDAHRQCLDGTIAFPFIFHQEEQGGSQAAEYQDKGDGDNDFHGDDG